MLACGTTGEFASMTLQERKRVVELCVANFHGEGRSVISHVSCCALEDTFDLCLHAKDVGCKGVLALPPFYFHGASKEVNKNMHPNFVCPQPHVKRANRGLRPSSPQCSRAARSRLSSTIFPSTQETPFCQRRTLASLLSTQQPWSASR